MTPEQPATGSQSGTPEPGRYSPHGAAREPPPDPPSAPRPQVSLRYAAAPPLLAALPLRPAPRRLAQKEAHGQRGSSGTRFSFIRRDLGALSRFARLCFAPVPSPPASRANNVAS